MFRRLVWFVSTLLLPVFYVHGAAAEQPKILVTIKPLHSIVSAITKGVNSPDLLIDGASSPHDFSLKPSQAQLVQSANMIVWVGPALEQFMIKPLETLATNAVRVQLVESDDDDHHEEKTEHKEDEHEEDHDGHDDGHGHGHGSTDPHVWLNPMDMVDAAKQISTALSKTDPTNAAAYAANLETLIGQLNDLDTELKSALLPLKERAFLTYHEGYSHLIERYDLTYGGSVSIDGDRRPGPAKLQALQAKIAKDNIVCIFSEPQFNNDLANTLSASGNIGTGVLDPLGADLPAGPEHYFLTLRALSKSLVDCLADS